MSLEPTPKLRWVEREEQDSMPQSHIEVGPFMLTAKLRHRVLQQWWSAVYVSGRWSSWQGEWRDVPLEIEA